jgi:lysine/ornithine N-monooxygenase
MNRLRAALVGMTALAVVSDTRICWDKRRRFAVKRNYSIDTRSSEIFVQNAELLISA